MSEGKEDNDAGQEESTVSDSDDSEDFCSVPSSRSRAEPPMFHHDEFIDE